MTTAKAYRTVSVRFHGCHQPKFLEKEMKKKLDKYYSFMLD